MGNKSSTTAKTAAATSTDGSTDPVTASSGRRPIPKNLTLLNGCTTLEEHEGCIRYALDAAEGMCGEDGLRALGFEFRFVPCCPDHAHEDDDDDDDDEHNKQMRTRSPESEFVPSNGDGGVASSTPPQLHREEDQPVSTPTRSSSRLTRLTSNINQKYANHCNSCATRLYHVGQPLELQMKSPKLGSTSATECQCHSETENECVENDKEKSENNEVSDKPPQSVSSSPAEAVMITLSNRQQFIADGLMYEVVANLAQEAAQAKMCTSFELEWITICNDQTMGNHVCAMVDREHRLLLEEGENRVALQELLMGNSNNASSSTEKEEKKEDEDNDSTTNKLLDSQYPQNQGMQQSSTTSSSSQHPTSLNKTKSTLLIATGRGKVRAGIFSRQHLLTAGIEVGTSWHCIREARMRRWGVAIIDPNARGEEVGFESFRRSMDTLFLNGMTEVGDVDINVNGGGANGDGNAATPKAVIDGQSKSNRRHLAHASSMPIQPRNSSAKNICRQSSCVPATSTSSSQQHSIYILAHSASGGQLVRHLREDPALLPSIRAIAFTDSTHNVQWCKHDPSLQEFLQTKNCVYLRSNDVRSSQSCVKVSSRGKDIWCDCKICNGNKKDAGMEADTDRFWQHRFGKIKTLWAGTAEHSLSNWAGHEIIWDHFDEHASDEEDGGWGGSVNDADDGVNLASL